MTSEDLRVLGRHLWAKSSDDGVGQSLLAHLLDVALVAEQLLSEPGARVMDRVARDLELSVGDSERLFVVLAGLHDLGKATPSFQAKWRAGAPPEALRRSWPDVPHGQASAIVLRDWLKESGVPKRAATVLAHAVGVHHGFLLPGHFFQAHSYSPDAIGEGSQLWEAWRAALCRDVVGAFGGLPAPPTRGYPSALSWACLAGLTSVADWIGSSLPHHGTVSDVEMYVQVRRAEVRERLERIAWRPGTPWWRPPAQSESFGDWFWGEGTPLRARPVQLAVEGFVRDGVSGPTLIVVEAPMGEGKTEAALYAMVHCRDSVGGYFALPTQATSDVMHARLVEFVDGHSSRHVEVALAHASARIEAAVAHFVPVDEEGRESAVTALSWFSTGRRELLAELGVGTVDQSLFAVLPVRHHFVRLWALQSKVVILDEVHAYDAYTSGLLAELLRWLAALSCTVIVMSATLPKAARRALLSAFDEGRGRDFEQLPDVGYPRVTVVDKEGVRSQATGASRPQRFGVGAVPHDPEQLGEAAVAAVHAGGAVACVVNQVDRAQALFLWCRQRLADADGVTLTLLHGRLPLDERRRREAEVVRRFGRASTYADRHGLVIATQVIEQSLDLDFDTMFTDLSPMDLLLQRAGRMHRHEGRQRPDAHARPVLHVAGLRSGPDGRPDPEVLDGVYSAHVLWRTWAALKDREFLEMPADIDGCVQLVYGEEPLAGLESFEAELRQAEAEHQQLVSNMRQAAQLWSIARPHEPATEGWGEGATDEETPAEYVARARTRLGDESLSAIPVQRSASGWQVSGWEGPPVPLDARRAPDAWAVAAVARQVRVGRPSLVRKLANQRMPSWWTAHPLLVRVVPLEFDIESRAVLEPSVSLDPQLGLVYPGRGKA